jgi:hypothetical protein
MIVNLDRAWSARVNAVFHTSPRDGGKPHAVWLPRVKLESDFSDLLFQDGVHICVDGPSGTGKTSLVLTQLTKERQKVLPIQLSRSVDWGDFCRLVVHPELDQSSRLSVELTAAFRNCLPEGAIKVVFGRGKRSRTGLHPVWMTPA